MSAVLGGVKDIREAVERAQAARTGPAHDRLRRRGPSLQQGQQDAFLPHVESGLFTFIGATTENPSFEVNSALLSRATVHVLKPLTPTTCDALLGARAGAARAPPLDEAARDRLIGYADGDARRLLNAYENLSRPRRRSAAMIDEALLEHTLGEQLRRYDKGGEQFYDTISALHKAVRGSDPDASLYWFVRMLDGGVDPRYVARRLVRMASEDIGLADPRALRMALDAAEAYERLGSPEGELALAEAVVYLAMAPKSNAVYTAFNAAHAFIKETAPARCRCTCATRRPKLMKELGYGKGYRYAHDEAAATPPASATGPTAWTRRLVRPVPRGLEIRSASSSPSCAGWTMKRNADCERGSEPALDPRRRYASKHRVGDEEVGLQRLVAGARRISARSR